MLVLESQAGLEVLILLGMVAHGTGIAIWAYVGLRGRTESHTFLDSQAVYLLLVIVQSVTLGQLGPPRDGKPNFFTQLGQPNWQVVLFALASGVCTATGNLAVQAAQAQMGTAIGPAMVSAVGLAGGVAMNYMLDDGLNPALLVFSGAACALAAVAFGALAHRAAEMHAGNVTDGAERATAGPHAAYKQVDVREEAFWVLPEVELQKVPCKTVEIGDCKTARSEAAGLLPVWRRSHDFRSGNCESGVALPVVRRSVDFDACEKGTLLPLRRRSVEVVSLRSPKHSASPNINALLTTKPVAIWEMETLQERLPQSGHPTSGGGRLLLGFATALAGGVLYAVLLPLYNLSVNDGFHVLKTGVPGLSAYCAFFYVAVASCGLSLLFAPLLLHYPTGGSPASSIRGYIADHHCRAWCILAGLLFWMGDFAMFIGGQGAGYGVAEVVSASPLVSTILGIVLFREFRDSSRQAQGMLAAQFVSYAAAIGFLIASANVRH
ncbi:hypothetical protein WJX72_009489 [[Myrmecia] bisecta]|uniref:Uncharacterized protein n=1 Tax=[Myrmecia] bisecta TaxID=41462 RepID=A0AAW1PQH2_9CHLO